MVQTDSTNLLIDCGPDFREQMLRCGLDRIDGVVLTHEHYDHVAGIDDLRPFCTGGTLPIYAEKFVIDHLLERIPYCFGKGKYPGTPTIGLLEIKPRCGFVVGDINIMPFRVMHGKLPIVGFRMGTLAYITDMKNILESGMELLDGVRTLVVNALHTKEHPTHQNVMQAIMFAKRVGASQTWFVHMSHRVGLHAIVDAKLPPSMHFAYDGLQIEV